MVIKKIDIGFDKLKWIYHLADLHFRLIRRHAEYRIVLNEFYEGIKKTGTENSIIAILGDLVHSKLDLSPEIIEESSNFLRNCADICPTILVAGNHDCFTGDHEVLTNHGWINIKHYVDNNLCDKIATFNQNTKEIEFQPPTNLIKKEFNGELYNLKGKNVDLLITPTHDILYSFNSSKFYKKSAELLPHKALIPINGIINNFIEDPFYQLLGFSFAEGTFVLRSHKIKSESKKYNGCRVQFHLKCEREILFLSNVLNKLNYKFNIRPQKDGSTYIVVYSKLGRKICEFFDARKEIPKTIFNTSLSKMKSFFGGYLHGDGGKYKSHRTFWSFSSISKESIDILHTIARLTGSTSNKSNRVIFGNYLNSKQQYLCTANINNIVNNTSLKSIKKIAYNGLVYCVSVPNTNLLIRRNGKICITGNCNLSNKSRLDSLSPIVKNLNHPNLFYLKETGIYKIANCLFNNMSVFDDIEGYIKTTEIPDTYKRRVDHLIGLFHGPITGATTDIGYTVNRSTPISLFDGNHIVLCGDIHKKQLIREFDRTNNKPAILFCGSVLQQNHGEDLLGHGYTIWDVEKREAKHVEIPNDYGFYTIEIRDGKLMSDLLSIPKKAHLRIKCFESDVTEVKRVVTDIRKVCDISEITYIRSEDKNLIKRSGLDKINLADVTNVDFQNKLIIDYLKSDTKLDDESVRIIEAINKELNNKIVSEDRLRNVHWIPKKFEFDNMFSYGEGNVVDFSKMKNTMGLFAANATGKTALMDALSFCIFDKSSRAFKAVNVMNNEKMSFWCKFNFEINGVDYFIERKAIRNKKGDVKVDVEFWKVENGNIVTLNGEARRGTNDIIRDYVGTYDDFILTALSLQGNNSNIIDKGQSDRKDLLAQFMGINVFDKLYNQALEETKEVNTLLKNLSKEDYTKKLAETEQRIEIGDVNYNKLVKTYEALLVNRNDLNASIIEKSSQIIKLPDVIDDVDKSKSDLEIAKSKKSAKEEAMAEKKKDVESLKEEKNSLTLKVEEFQNNKIEEKHAKYLVLCDELTEAETDVDKLKSSVSSKIEKLKHLDEHEYDPNCKYCMNNIFVKDAIKTREELTGDKTVAVERVTKAKTIKVEILRFGNIESDYSSFIETKKLLESKTSKFERESSEIKSLNLEIGNLTNRIKTISDAIDLYNQSITSISKNKEIEKELAILRKRLSNLDETIKDKNKEVMELNGNLILWKSQKSDIEQTIEKIKGLENKNIAYEYYLNAVKRDGVPFDLILKTIPIIENEINNILSQIVEFGVMINIEEKNINLNIVYEDRSWPLELSSGMERFIASLAIRVALINISNLPRPNFIAVDEGFGALDANNMSSVFSLLTYLKTQFDFMIIVSHLDVMRDFVDSHIEVKKENGFSKVVFD